MEQKQTQTETITRDDVKKLIVQRDRIEQEIMGLVEELEGPGMPGLKGNLVNKDGFPRNDIDIHNIRTKRHRLACLQTDYSEISKKLEQGLHVVLAKGNPVPVTKSDISISTDGSGRNVASIQVFSHAEEDRMLMAEKRRGFAYVDVVDDNSPASQAGLLKNDIVLAFGSVRANSYGTSDDALRALPPVVQSSIDSPLVVRVLRQNQELSLTLIPRRWEGNGFLGCRLKPVDSTR